MYLRPIQESESCLPYYTISGISQYQDSETIDAEPGSVLN